MRDFANSIVGKNKADECWMIFRTPFKQGAFVKRNLCGFSYKFKQSAFLMQILYDFSLLLR
ncbi:hypothetical protein, partial [Cohnella xylanilytica]|uniref:hypothetical protein n=1 Tax=Cohnella xylanilytica TaxID=557555 RepID=UPI001C86E30C